MSSGTRPAGSDTGAGRRALRWLFVNRKTGSITVAQWPNVLLAVFIIATLAGRIFHPAGALHTALRDLGTLALCVWALDEVARGVNPFRRGLGAAVLVATLVNIA